MSERGPLTRDNLKSHRAAAIAGILFSIILILAFWLLRISVPDLPKNLGHGSNPNPTRSHLPSTSSRSRELRSCGSLACCATVSVNARISFLLQYSSERIVVFGNAVCGSRSSRRAYHLI
jgi:hypothetical protein